MDRTFGLLAVACLILAGCGGTRSADPAAPATSAEDHSASAEPQPKLTNNGSADVAAETKGNSPKVVAKASEPDGETSSDVWFDDPLAELARGGPEKVQTTDIGVLHGDERPEKDSANPATSSTEVAAAPLGGGTSNSPDGTSTPNGAEAPDDQDKVGWKSLISAATIQDEIKRIRVRTTGNLRSLSTYSAHYKEIQVDGAVLAALAGIAISHPEPLNWKANAKHVRDLASQMSTFAKVVGAKPLTETKKVFEKIVLLLDGDVPSDLPEAAAELPFSEVSPRGRLMGRFQSASEWMKSTVTNQATLKRGSDRVIQEAELVAALGKIISTAGYDSVDEEEYQRFIKELLYASVEIIDADQAGDFEAFLKARNRMEGSCMNCHIKYRVEVVKTMMR